MAVLAVVFALQWAREVLIPLVLALFISYLLDPVVAWLNKVQKAASELEKAAAEAAGAASPPKGPTKVEVTRPALNIRDYIWVGTVGVFGFALQALLIFFLVYFLLLSGSAFRRKLVKIAGPSLAKKRITVQILDEIKMQLKRFLLVQLYTSLFMAVAIWLAFRWIGLENAGMWGIVAGILKSIPFLGGTVIIGGTALVGYLQFGTISMALKSLEGRVVSPLMTSKAGQIHTVWIFVGILFWGWIWGVWGLLLGIPIILVAKAVCDRIEGLKPIGELLGD